MSDPASIPFQAAAITGQAIDRITRRLRARHARRRAESVADGQWLSTLAALKSEVHVNERASSG